MATARVAVPLGFDTGTPPICCPSTVNCTVPLLGAGEIVPVRTSVPVAALGTRFRVRTVVTDPGEPGFDGVVVVVVDGAPVVVVVGCSVVVVVG